MSNEGLDPRPVRVSFILHKFSRGGSDRVAAYLARGFAKAGMDVDLTVFAKGGEVESLLVDLTGQDIPVTYLKKSSRWRPVDLVLGLLPLARRLSARAPDVVISTANNTSLATAIGIRLAGLRNARLALKTTNPIATSRHRGLARRIRLWSYEVIFRWTDAVWTLSADESEEMRAEFPAFKSLFVDVANPYVTDRMLAASKPSEPGRGKTIVSIARLTSQKRLDRLIAAFAHVRSPDTRLIILGEGEDRAKLQALIGSLGLENRVVMPGYVDDVAAFLARADLFVLTSAYEGFPAAILEAMAANCPVLSTDCFPAARTLLGSVEGASIIHDVAPEELGAQMERALQQPRPSALRSVAENYSIANGVASHLKAMATLLQREVKPSFATKLRTRY